MPELPEVETVRRGLANAFGLEHSNQNRQSGAQNGAMNFSKNFNKFPQLQGWHFARPNLRYPLPIEKLHGLKGACLLSVERRSKFLLLYFSHILPPPNISLPELTQNIKTWGRKLQLRRVIIHLGMTGVLKILPQLPDELGKHDHLWALFHVERPTQESPQGKQHYLLYNDVRRFGFWDYQELQETFQLMKPFASVGCEPIPLEQYRLQAPLTLALANTEETSKPIALNNSRHDFAALGEYLYHCSRKIQRPIKPWLLDGKIVCGVGNIYCSESLWLAGLRPQKNACELSYQQATKLATAIEKTITAAIKAGGTTFKDFRNSTGKPGYFQQELRVYGHEGKSCPHCSHPIIKQVQAQRATYYCSQCQI